MGVNNFSDLEEASMETIGFGDRVAKKLIRKTFSNWEISGKDDNAKLTAEEAVGANEYCKHLGIKYKFTD